MPETQENLFFKVPFAQNGDRAAIPGETQADGSVNMADGWGFDYERNPETDEHAKDVDREATNGLNYMITAALRELQTQGCFSYITPAMNGGQPFAYAKAAHCYYVDGANGPDIYKSLVDNNTSLPTDKSKWQRLGASDPFFVGEFYPWRHPQTHPGFEVADGTILTALDEIYPEAWEYFQTPHGQMLCKTEAQWQAQSVKVEYTLADGTQTGWNGIGGNPWYVLDVGAKTLRLPDIRGTLAEPAGFDLLDVGGSHLDMIRNLYGKVVPTSATATGNAPVAAFSEAEGAFALQGDGIYMNALLTRASSLGTNFIFNAQRAVPTGNANKVRSWGALSCVYLGAPK